MRASEILTERYVNAFKTDEKQKYAQIAWDMLQRSYESIGGIKGSGFESPESMVKSNYMFKIGMDSGTPVSVSVYKNKGGARKMVALGTDGSMSGVDMARDTLKSMLKTGRAFGEFSGPVFGSVKKMIPPDVLTTMLVPANEVAGLLNKEITIGPGPDMKMQGTEDPYAPYYYQREIGGELHTKIAYGDPQASAARFD